jgi:hypothetical protein
MESLRLHTSQDNLDGIKLIYMETSGSDKFYPILKLLGGLGNFVEQTLIDSYLFLCIIQYRFLPAFIFTKLYQFICRREPLRPDARNCAEAVSKPNIVYHPKQIAGSFP